MKITNSKQSNKFQPVTISMTFESQQELDAMGSLFNTCVINDYLQTRGIMNNPYESFRDAGANIDKTEEVKKSIENHPSISRHF
jgi:hypothetical protein